jgi:hypothetical protein
MSAAVTVVGAGAAAAPLAVESADGGFSAHAPAAKIASARVVTMRFLLGFMGIRNPLLFSFRLKNFPELRSKLAAIRFL